MGGVSFEIISVGDTCGVKKRVTTNIQRRWWFDAGPRGCTSIGLRNALNEDAVSTNGRCALHHEREHLGIHKCITRTKKFEICFRKSSHAPDAQRSPVLPPEP